MRIRTPPCSPTGSRCRWSPETRTSTSARIAQLRIRSSSGSPVTASGSSGAGSSPMDRSTRSSSTACNRCGSKPSFPVRIRSSSTITGSGRTSSKRASITSSRTRLGGPAAMNAETMTFVSQATRRISRARSASRQPETHCPRVRFRGPRPAHARSAGAQRSARFAPDVAGRRGPPHYASYPGFERVRRSLQRGRQAGKQKEADSYENIISAFFEVTDGLRMGSRQGRHYPSLAGRSESPRMALESGIPPRGRSSVGRARASQARGRGFETRRPLPSPLYRAKFFAGVRNPLRIWLWT